MDLWSSLLMIWALWIVVLSNREQQVTKLVDPHCVPDLEVAIGPFVGQICDYDLGPFDESDDLTL